MSNLKDSIFLDKVQTNFHMKDKCHFEDCKMNNCLGMICTSLSLTYKLGSDIEFDMNQFYLKKVRKFFLREDQAKKNNLKMRKHYIV
jgi:hypothetical protein